MTFTCNIQKVNFFIDQVEDKGQVNLEEAIEIFQNFPFDAQLKEARGRELTSCLPTVSFKSADDKALVIWAENDTGFFIYYDNGKQFSKFFLSNNLQQNPHRLAVEEFIEFFFHEKIEDELDLKDKEISDEEKAVAMEQPHYSNRITYSYSDTKKYKFYLWTLPWVVLALFLLKMDAEKKFEFHWGIHLLFSLFWLPGIIVHISYWLKNSGSLVIIDIKEKSLTYEKHEERIRFKREDIHHCEINETRSFKAPWSSYRYIWFVLKDGRQIVITNFITEPENIISSLKPNFKIEKRTIPFLPI